MTKNVVKFQIYVARQMVWMNEWMKKKVPKEKWCFYNRKIGKNDEG